MDSQGPMVPGTHNLNRLLDELRQVGQEPDRALLDRVKAYGPAAVRPLMEMALAEELHNAPSDHPEVWAPIHAIQLLGEIGAPEAVEPLLSLLNRVDDETLTQTLVTAFSGIGAPAMGPLRALAFDRTRDVWVRIAAVESLGKIGQRHPELRSEVVSLLARRLDPAESQTPDDESINGFVINELLDLEAREAATAIRQAFTEDRVDTSVVDLDQALDELGVPAAARPARPAERAWLALRLRCTACGYEREHEVETVYCDLPTLERRERGDSTVYSEFVIPQRITCPKCGAVDHYELSNLARMALVAEQLRKQVGHPAGEPVAEAEEGVFRPMRFTLADGREMRPLAARDLYRQQVEADPNRADLRVRYADILGFLGYREEATEHYRAALSLERANLDASLNLGRLARASGDLAEARRMFEHVLAQARGSPLPRRTREDYVAAAVDELAELSGSPTPSSVTLMSERRSGGPVGRGPETGAHVQPVRSARKVGRNDPCPCGSGKKYKRCHGR